MIPSEEPTSKLGPSPARRDGTHLEAHASGESSIYQAGGDQNFHYVDGVHERLRTESGNLVRECPYPGLAAFGPEQAKWFFGRDGLITELTAHLDRRTRTGGIQVVVAPSGAGKSSLLRAGLLPKLDRAALPGSDRWPKLVLTPTATPIWALATDIAARTGTRTDVVAGQLAADPRRCLSTLLPAPPGQSRIVLVVDQFEELFTLCTDEQQRQAFIALLTRIAGGGPDAGTEPVGLVVVGLRADFYAACVNYPQLRAALQDAPLVVGPMSEPELREAIIYPARNMGLKIEPGLVELLLRDLGAASVVRTGPDDTGGYEAGRLPLLAHALRVSWQHRNGATVTVQSYRDTGGIQHAVAITADQMYAGLDETGRRLTRSLFLRLVKIGDGTEDTRRRVSHAELVSATADPPKAALVVDAFTQARLLTLRRDTVEITHEALLRSWPLLRGWIDEDRAGRLTHQKLEEAATAWESGQRDPSLLYRGNQLHAAHAWATAAAPGELSPAARSFLGAATGAHRRTARRKKATTVTLAVALVIVLAAGVVAVLQGSEARDQQSEAERQRDLVLYNQILANADRLRDTDASLSAQLALVAHRIRPTDETYTRLVTAGNAPLSTPFSAHGKEVGTVAFSPDGKVMATGSDDYTVRLWNVSDPARPTAIGQPLSGHGGAVTAVAFSPDGRTLATGCIDGAVRLWNVTDPSRPTALGQPDPNRAAEQGRPLTGLKGRVNSLAFSPDGRTLASGGYTGGDTGGPPPALWLWNVSDPARATPLSQSFASHVEISSVAFGPDGRVLATGLADHTVQLWSVADPAQPAALGAPLTGHTDGVSAVAFTPDGRTLVSGGRDEFVRMWNVADPARPTVLGLPRPGHTGGVQSMAISASGGTLAVGSADHKVRLWNFSAPSRPTEIMAPLTGHTTAVHSVAFRPDSPTLASGGTDGTVRLWQLPPTLRTGYPGTPATFGNPVFSVAVSPDGHTVAIGTVDNYVRLADITDPSRPRFLAKPLEGHRITVCAVAFSPDGRTLASGSFDQTVRLWDVSDPGRPTRLGQPLTGHNHNVCALAFSPDGRTLAAGSHASSVQLWDVSDPGRPAALGPPLAHGINAVDSVTFSRNGRVLITGTMNSTIYVWDVTDPRRGATLGGQLTGHSDSVQVVTFSPDGRTMATGSSDRTVRLWNVADPTRPTALGQPLTGHTGVVDEVAFSPDGRTLATGSSDKTVRLWDVADPARPFSRGQPLLGHGRGYTGYPALAFTPDGHALVVSGDEQSIRLWNLDVEPNIERICAFTANTLTPDEWRRHVGDIIPYRPPCT